MVCPARAAAAVPERSAGAEAGRGVGAVPAADGGAGGTALRAVQGHAAAGAPAAEARARRSSSATSSWCGQPRAQAGRACAAVAHLCLLSKLWVLAGVLAMMEVVMSSLLACSTFALACFDWPMWQGCLLRGLPCMRRRTRTWTR